MIYESEKPSLLHATPYCSQWFCPFAENNLLQNDHVLLKRHSGFFVQLSACQSPKVQLKKVLSHKQVLLQFHSLLWQGRLLVPGFSHKKSPSVVVLFWLNAETHIAWGNKDSKKKSLCYILGSIFHSAKKIYF